MTRLPSVRPSEVVAALKKAGFVEKRQKGSHLTLWHERQRRTTMVALHGRDLPVPTLKQILKQAGLSEKEFYEFLRENGAIKYLAGYGIPELVFKLLCARVAEPDGKLPEFSAIRLLTQRDRV